MPSRKVPLVNNELYHIYNRGTEKRIIFTNYRDFKRFKQTVFYYIFQNHKLSFSKYAKSELDFSKVLGDEKVVEIICYCFMPNHFHLLIRQLKDKGITNFIGKVCNSYTKYFNIKYNRVGPLLQGEFKSVHIETNEQLIHLSRYIHLNPVVTGIVKKPESYEWSSYNEYLSRPQILCDCSIVLDQFESPQVYQKFVEGQIDYGISLEILKHQVLDADFDEVYDATPGVDA